MERQQSRTSYPSLTFTATQPMDTTEGRQSVSPLTPEHVASAGFGSNPAPDTPDGNRSAANSMGNPESALKRFECLRTVVQDQIIYQELKKTVIPSQALQYMAYIPTQQYQEIIQKEEKSRQEAVELFFDTLCKCTNEAWPNDLYTYLEENAQPITADILKDRFKKCFEGLQQEQPPTTVSLRSLNPPKLSDKKTKALMQRKDLSQQVINRKKRVLKTLDPINVMDRMSFLPADVHERVKSEKHNKGSMAAMQWLIDHLPENAGDHDYLGDIYNYLSTHDVVVLSDLQACERELLEREKESKYKDLYDILQQSQDSRFPGRGHRLDGGS